MPTPSRRLKYSPSNEFPKGVVRALSFACSILTQAYKNHFKNPEKFGLPQFKAKHHSKASYTSNYVNNNIRYEEDGKYIRLPKVGLLRIRQLVYWQR